MISLAQLSCHSNDDLEREKESLLLSSHLLMIS